MCGIEETKLFKFDRTQAYRLVGVTDKNKIDKVNSRALYKERIGCVAVDFRYDNYNVTQENQYKLHIKFIQKEDGQFCNINLITSQIEKIVETDNGVNVTTHNSIYIFERAELSEVIKQEDANLIELFMSAEDDYLFGRGFYYDDAMVAHELIADVNAGMFQDSVLICFKSAGVLSGCVGRYFPSDAGVEFYDTIYCQEEYEFNGSFSNACKSLDY